VVAVNSAAEAVIDPWANLIGQKDATARLNAWIADPVHAFLFVGPAGSGKKAAAQAFAGAVLAHGLDDAAAERHIRLATEGKHADVELFSPEARQIDVDSMAELTKMVFKKPIEGRRRIVIADRFHAATPPAAASLLKTVEEPPPSAMIIILTEGVIPEHVPIASRCVEVPFPALSDELIASWLQARGHDEERSRSIATAAAGDVGRAQLLVDDHGFAQRAEAWRRVPVRLDGTGAVVGVVVDDLREMIDEATELATARHMVELEELAEREDLLGTRGSGRKDMEARHKREIRKVRDDELRFGLGVLARRYRDRIAGGGGLEFVEAVSRLRDANDALLRNPNEALLLLNLFWNLPSLPDDDGRQLV